MIASAVAEMRSPIRSMWLAAAALALLAGGAVAQHSSTQQSGTVHSSNVLINAGFVMRAADTPDKVARLKRFPADKFASRKTGDGRVYYVYADPVYCVCAYVGTQQAMDNYRKVMAPVFDTSEINRQPARGTNVAADLIHDMTGDDVENAFNDDAFHPWRF